MRHSRDIAHAKADAFRINHPGGAPPQFRRAVGPAGSHTKADF